MNIVDELFEQTKQAIKEILYSDFANKVKKYVYNDVEYKFSEETVLDMLPKLQAINAGILDEIETYDVDGNVKILSAEEFVARNHEGFKNKMLHEVDLGKLLKILEEIQTFTAFANFGSFDMAKQFYLDAKKEEIVEEVVEEVTEEDE